MTTLPEAQAAPAAAVHETPTTPSAPTAARTPAPTVLRTRKQIQAAAISEQAELRANWKRSLPRAQQTWSKIDARELADAQGNLHRLAGLVQLRYRTTREEADRQVAAFVADTPA